MNPGLAHFYRQLFLGCSGLNGFEFLFLKKIMRHRCKKAGRCKQIARRTATIAVRSVQLAKGLTHINRGSTELAKGLTDIASRSEELANGLTDIARSTADIARSETHIAGHIALSVGFAAHLAGKTSAIAISRHFRINSTRQWQPGAPLIKIRKASQFNERPFFLSKLFYQFIIELSVYTNPGSGSSSS